MDLIKNGKLLCDLRRARGMTQKEVAEKLGVVPKTVSKWETGHGFPDVSMLTALAKVLGVDEKVLLSGELSKNRASAGNIQRISFYVCPDCGSMLQGVGAAELVCCGKPLMPLTAQETDDTHTLRISELENDYYIEFNHEMTKQHYISFVAHVRFDRVLTVKLYPEQAAAVRIPKLPGRLYYYCSNHGLFAYAYQRT